MADIQERGDEKLAPLVPKPRGEVLVDLLGSEERIAASPRATHDPTPHFRGGEEARGLRLADPQDRGELEGVRPRETAQATEALDQIDREG